MVKIQGLAGKPAEFDKRRGGGGGKCALHTIKQRVQSSVIRTTAVQLILQNLTGKVASSPKLV